MASSVESNSSQQYVDFDEYINFQIEKTRSGIKLTDFLTAAAGIATLWIGYLLVFTLLDHWVVRGGFNETTRVLMFLAVALCGCAWIGWIVVVPYLRNVSDLFAAKAIERSSPELKSTLLNVVDLQRSGRSAPPQIQSSLEKRAAVALSHIDVNQVIDRRWLMRLSFALLTVVVLCCLYTVFSPKHMSFARPLLPLLGSKVATQTEIFNVEPGDAEILARTQLEVSVDLRGKVPESVVLYYTTDDRRYVDEPVEMRPVEDEQKRFRVVVNGENGRGILQNLTYRIEAGDAFTREYRVRINQPPTAAVDEIRYEYPDYMKLPDRTRSTGQIDAWEGTTVSLKATANMAVTTAAILFSDTEDTSVKAEEIRMKIAGGTQLTANWPLEIRSDGTYPHYYRIQIKNENGQIDREPTLYSIQIRPDLPPEVALIDPVRDLEMPANGIVPILVEANDPDFLLRSLYLKLEQHDEPFKPRTIFVGEKQQVRTRYDLHLSELELKTDDVVTFSIEATDNRRPYGNKSITPRINIRIVDPVSDEQVQQKLEADKQKQQEQLDQQEPQRGEQEQQQEGTDDESQQPEDQQQTGNEDGQGNQEGSSDENSQAPKQGSKSGTGSETDTGDESSTGSKTGDNSQRPLDPDGADDAQVLDKLLERQRQRSESDSEEPPESEPSKDNPPANADRTDQPDADAGQQDDSEKSDTEKPNDNQPSKDEPSEDGQGEMPDEKRPNDSKSGKKPADTDDGQSEKNDKPEPGGEKPSADDDKTGDDADSNSNKPSADDKNSGDDGDGSDESPKDKNAADKDDPSNADSETNKADSDQGDPDAEPKPSNKPDENNTGQPKRDAADSKPTESDANKQGTPKADRNADGDPMPEKGGDEKNKEGDDGSKKSQDGKSGSKKSESSTDKNPNESPKGDAPKSDDAQPGKPTGEEEKGDGSKENNMKKDAPKRGSEGETKDGAKKDAPSDEGPKKPSPDNEERPSDREKTQVDKTEPGKESSAEKNEPGGKPDQGDQSKKKQGRQENDGDPDKQESDRKDAPKDSPQPKGQDDSQTKKQDAAAKKDPDSKSQPGQDAQPAEGNKPGDGNEQGKDGDSKKGEGQKSEGQKSGGGQKPGEGSEAKEEASGGNKEGKPDSGQGTSPKSSGGSPSNSGNNGRGGQPGTKSGKEENPAERGGAGEGDDPDGPDASGDGEADAGPDGADDPDLESAKKATDLVLKKLERELKRGEVDAELLEELGWTEEQMKKFSERMRRQLNQNDQDDSAESLARRKQFDELLKSLNVKSKGTSRRDRNQRNRVLESGGSRRLPVPAAYRELYEDYTRQMLKRKQKAK